MTKETLLFESSIHVHLTFIKLSGSFSRGDKMAYISDSMLNAMQPRLIAPGLHEREQKARMRP